MHGVCDVYVRACVQTFDSPDFNLTGPSTVMLGAPNVFHVDVHLPAPMSFIVVEAFTPTNFTDAMSVCSIAVVQAGSNFDCVPYEKFDHTVYPSESGLTNQYGRLEVTDIFNAGQ